VSLWGAEATSNSAVRGWLTCFASLVMES